MDRQPIPVEPIQVDKPNRAEKDADELALSQFTSANIGDGRLVKMEVDYAPQVDEALPKADSLAKVSVFLEVLVILGQQILTIFSTSTCFLQTNVVAAIESLSSLEKQTRLGADMRSNSRILRHLVKLAFEAQKWELLNETIVAMSKKRSLIKFAIKNMVQDCCEMVDKVPTEADRNTLIDTLRTVTAGKIYVEVERARLTKRVVKKLEAEGKIEEAWNAMIELQVETFGSMEMPEKVRFLLDQVRLSIQRKDFVRAAIISNKISVKFFDNKADDVSGYWACCCSVLGTKTCFGCSNSIYFWICVIFLKIFAGFCQPE